MMRGTILALTLCAAACSPDTRSPADLPAHTSEAPSTAAACEADDTAYTISGTAILDPDMKAGQNVDPGQGFPQEGKAFLYGLPCRQAKINPDDGSFSLELTAADVEGMALGPGSLVSLIAWWVPRPFSEGVAAARPVTLAENSEAGTMTLTWIDAGHITVDFASTTGIIASVTVLGLSDEEAHGFGLADITGATTFNTNYLPAGTYEFQITTDRGETLSTNLTFPEAAPESGENQWFATTVTL